jgi:hypothetical protein
MEPARAVRAAAAAADRPGEPTSLTRHGRRRPDRLSGSAASSDRDIIRVTGIMMICGMIIMIAGHRNLMIISDSDNAVTVVDHDRCDRHGPGDFTHWQAAVRDMLSAARRRHNAFK